MNHKAKAIKELKDGEQKAIKDYTHARKRFPENKKTFSHIRSEEEEHYKMLTHIKNG